MKRALLFIAAALLVLAAINPTYATDYTSGSFTIRDSVIEEGGGSASSTSNSGLSTTGQNAPGVSTSVNFELRSGFLYYSQFTIAPVVSATAGSGQAQLTWTAAIGNVAIDHYELGTATVSGGPYTYENVGAVLSFTKSSLTGDIQYYFVIRAHDATDAIRVTSAEATATPAVLTQCNDGIDNDGDGLIDLADAGCSGASDNDESGPAGGGSFFVSISPTPEPPFAPTSDYGEALSTTVIRWHFIDGSSNEEGFEIRDNSNGLRSSGTADITSLDEGGLFANSPAVGRRIFAFNSFGNSPASATYATVYTLIETPTALIASSSGVPSSLTITAFSPGGFSNLTDGWSGIEIQNITEGTSSGWLQTDSVLFSGLAVGSSYQFRARARNADGIVTPYSSAFLFTIPRVDQRGPIEPDAEPSVDNESPSENEPITPADEADALVSGLGLAITDPIDGLDIEKPLLVPLIGKTEPFAVVTLNLQGVTITSLANAAGVFRFDLRNLPSGDYTATVIATAQDGRRSSPDTISFTITGMVEAAVAPPTITPVSPGLAPPPEIVQPSIFSVIIPEEMIILPGQKQATLSWWFLWTTLFASLLSLDILYFTTHRRRPRRKTRLPNVYNEFQEVSRHHKKSSRHE